MEREFATNSGTVTPFASKMKKTPIVIIPPTKMMMASQMIGPAQHRTNKKNMIDNTIAAPTAATSTIHPV